MFVVIALQSHRNYNYNNMMLQSSCIAIYIYLSCRHLGSSWVHPMDNPRLCPNGGLQTEACETSCIWICKCFWGAEQSGNLLDSKMVLGVIASCPSAGDLYGGCSRWHNPPWAETTVYIRIKWQIQEPLPSRFGEDAEASWPFLCYEQVQTANGSWEA